MLKGCVGELSYNIKWVYKTKHKTAGDIKFGIKKCKWQYKIAQIRGQIDICIDADIVKVT